MTRPCEILKIRARLCVALAAGVVSVGTLAGPAFGEQPTRRAGVETAPALTPEQVRERLEHRLAQARRLVERLEGAIRQLDEGGEPGEVARGRALLDGSRGEPPPRAGRRGEGPRSESREVTPEDVAAFLREHLPELTERIEALAAERPQAAVEGLMRVFAPQVAAILHTPDEAMRDLRTREMVNRYRLMQAGQAVRAARQRRDAEAAREGEARFVELAAEQHTLRREAVELEIRAIERRLGELRERLDDEAESSAAFIERLRRELDREPRARRDPQ
ncbi:MAG: hypothetical protein EA378_11205 [Phycisphaerales bacterium]|nr:MAG: hypothetical protein EA378_11205 [Phycisphaerales bacterium]